MKLFKITTNDLDDEQFYIVADKISMIEEVLINKYPNINIKSIELIDDDILIQNNKI